MTLLVFSTVALVLSLMLLFLPGVIRRWNEKLSSNYDIDSTLQLLNTHFPTNHLLYHHAKVIGTSLLLGSVVFLLFLFGRMNAVQFAAVFFDSGQMSTIQEIVFSTIIIFSKLIAVVGIGMGIGLLFAPEKIYRLNETMAKILSVDPFFERLNRNYQMVDNLFLRHSKIFGLMGLLASSILIWIIGKYLLKGA
jgi:hypothetical protein